MPGRVHSIDTFSTLDGPGIRTVIFMQGCCLHCKYCHNPDTWQLKSKNSKEYAVDELMQLILKNKPYFQASGGGITFSGGEPLLQHDFIKEIFIHCRQEDISTAFDSSLYVSVDIVSSLLNYTDLVLADIKQMDSLKSSRLVGTDNELNLRNINNINDNRTPLWIRYVVVPGWTDDINDIRSMAEFIAPLDCVERVDLLPYHSLGKHKWSMLGMVYELNDVQPPSYEQMRELKTLVEDISGKTVVMHE